MSQVGQTGKTPLLVCLRLRKPQELELPTKTTILAFIEAGAGYKSSELSQDGPTNK